MTTSLGAAFLWTDGKRCYRAPAPRRTLYRGSAQRPGGCYHFVGHHFALCECGAYRRRKRPCSMCGSSRVRA